MKYLIILSDIQQNTFHHPTQKESFASGHKLTVSESVSSIDINLPDSTGWFETYWRQVYNIHQ